ncbi:hypothetical protein, partial [Acutalibacter muris]|uniref:hypothetical protein n=1 Tax=Acutalibacter muris TaxID=1796620 RepID=UPI0026F3E8BA
PGKPVKSRKNGNQRISVRPEGRPPRSAVLKALNFGKDPWKPTVSGVLLFKIPMLSRKLYIYGQL